MMMEKIEETLNEREKKMLSELAACKHACEELVKKTLQHYEQAYIAEQECLSSVQSRIGLDRLTYVISVDYITGHISKALRTDYNAQNIIATLRTSSDIRKYVRDFLSKEE